MNWIEEKLRSDLNQAIYDLSCGLDEKETKKARAYIYRKIKEIKQEQERQKEINKDYQELEILDKERRDFLTDRGFKLK